MGVRAFGTDHPEFMLAQSQCWWSVNCIRADQGPGSNGSVLPTFPTGWHSSVKNKIYSINKTHKNRDGLNFLLGFATFRVYFDTHF